MGCSNELPKIGNIECSNIQPPKREYTFKDGKCFCDGQLLGIIKQIEGKKITVEHKNGSFADGTIRVFYVA
jgi:hypothetical protein